MDIKELIDVMKKLRDPDGGCPWDLKQTFKTIVPYTIEEAYEVADAIEKDDFNELKLELGDLLFQVVFYSQLAAEKNYFVFDDVVEAIVDKMIRRHPHVFSDTRYENEQAFNKAWEQQKKKEKAVNANADSSLLDGIPGSLPALKQAQKIQKKVATHGFDWVSIEPVFDKLDEENAELKQAIENKDEENIAEEVGDLLFTVVNIARHLGVDAESACRQASRKFEKRFRLVENMVKSEKQGLEQFSEAELIDLWEKAKMT